MTPDPTFYFWVAGIIVGFHNSIIFNVFRYFLSNFWPLRSSTTIIFTYLNFVGFPYFFVLLKSWTVEAITNTFLCFWLPRPRFLGSDFSSSSLSVSTLSKKPSSSSTILSSLYLLSLWKLPLVSYIQIYIFFNNIYGLSGVVTPLQKRSSLYLLINELQ